MNTFNLWKLEIIKFKHTEDMAFFLHNWNKYDFCHFWDLNWANVSCFLLIASHAMLQDIYLKFCVEILQTYSVYLKALSERSSRLSVLISTQLVKLIGSKYACAQSVSNLLNYWAILMKWNFCSLSWQVSKIPTLFPLFWQLQLFLRNLNLCSKSKNLQFY